MLPTFLWKPWYILFFRILWIESSKEQHLSEIEICINFMNVFTVTFDLRQNLFSTLMIIRNVSWAANQHILSKTLKKIMIIPNFWPVVFVHLCYCCSLLLHVIFSRNRRKSLKICSLETMKKHNLLPMTSHRRWRHTKPMISSPGLFAVST